MFSFELSQRDPTENNTNTLLWNYWYATLILNMSDTDDSDQNMVHV